LKANTCFLLEKQMKGAKLRGKEETIGLFAFIFFIFRLEIMLNYTVIRLMVNRWGGLYRIFPYILLLKLLKVKFKDIYSLLFLRKLLT